jgi:Tol biopolymer transport system component
VLAAASPALATPPGENGRIVFASDATGSVQLYTVGPFGHGLRQLTHLVVGDAVHPDWSPNARKIVFELDTETGCSVILMRADGSHQRALPHPPGGECDGQPSFTPDGRRIVFGSFNPTTNDEAIWIERLDGSHQRRLATSPSGKGATDPNVSPDGTRLTFVAFNGQDLGQGLIRTGIRGRTPELLLPYTTDVAIKHDWAPNNRRIVFTNNADFFEQSANIGTLRPDGVGPVRWLTHYTDPERRAYTGSYSPNGRWIVYRLEDHGRYALMRMHPDGTHGRVILPLSDFRPRYIDWGSTPD